MKRALYVMVCTQHNRHLSAIFKLKSLVSFGLLSSVSYKRKKAQLFYFDGVVSGVSKKVHLTYFLFEKQQMARKLIL